MPAKNIEELKQRFPKLWQKASKQFEDEDARKKAFLALVEFQKARIKEQIAKEKLRKKRTRALILWATGLIRELSPDEIGTLVKKTKRHLIAKEGKQTVDYSPYLLDEVKQVHPNFEIENISAEEIKEKLQQELQEKFKKASEKALQKIKSHP